MGINKLIDKEGNVLFDLSQDTIKKEAVKKGFIFHDKHGEILIGTGIEETAIAATPTFFEDNVIFYDYDNYSFAYVYTNEEIANLSALPSGIEHDNLTFIGWNFSLEDIKNGVTHQVFPMYKTSDGKLYIGIETSSDNQSLTLNSSLAKYIVNWGDGTETTGTTTHTYATKGTYEITIDSNKANFTFVSPFSSSNGVIRYVYLSEYVNALGSQCLSGYGLSSVVIPSSVTSIGSSAFSSCYGLSSVVIPSSVTSIGSSAFYNCSPLYYDLTTHLNPPQIASLLSIGFENSTSATRRTGQYYFIQKGTKSKYATATNWATIYAYNPSMFVEVEI